MIYVVLVKSPASSIGRPMCTFAAQCRYIYLSSESFLETRIHLKYSLVRAFSLDLAFMGLPQNSLMFL